MKRGHLTLGGGWGIYLVSGASAVLGRKSNRSLKVRIGLTALNLSHSLPVRVRVRVSDRVSDRVRV